MTILLTNRRERSRFLRFAVVGVIGFVVDFGVYNLMLSVLPERTWLLSSVVAAGVVSFVAAIISNFLWNRYWTYPDSRTKPMLGQLAQFGFISVLGLGIRIPLLWLLEAPLYHMFSVVPLPLPEAVLTFLAHNTDLAFAVGVVMFWNFFANRYWTYNDVPV